ncbi:MAG: hypothetical protein AAB511_01085 [Patescibacteria group bacterium]
MAEEKEKKVGGENISNTEWGMVIFVLLIIDGIQIGLNFAFLSGVIINRFLDMGIGLAWSTYLKLRGVKLDAKKIVSIGATFGLEMLPGIDMLPLWTLDGILIFALVKAEKELKKVAKVAIAVAAVALAPETGGASVAAAGAAEGAVAAGAEGAAAGAEGVAAEGAGGEVGGEGGPSDEYADSMGQESADPEAGDGSENLGEEGGQGDENNDISDEEADDLGEDSDNTLEERENETPADKAKREEGEGKNKRRNRQKKSQQGQGGSLFGGGQREGEGGGTGADPLNLRDNSGRNANNRDNLKTRSNLLDLSLSYGARKKQKDDADEQSFSA